MLERLGEGNLDRETLNKLMGAGEKVLKRPRKFASTRYTEKKGGAAGENPVCVVKSHQCWDCGAL